MLDPVLGVLRRTTVPDLSAYGLPAPRGGMYRQFLQTHTVPILDHGFVGAIRERRIEVVGEVVGFDGPDVLLAENRRVTVDDVISATGFGTGLEPIVGHLGVLGDAARPLVHGERTAPGCPDLYFVGITEHLAGLLRLVGKQAEAVARAVADPIRSRARTWLTYVDERLAMNRSRLTNRCAATPRTCAAPAVATIGS